MKHPLVIPTLSSPSQIPLLPFSLLKYPLNPYAAGDVLIHPELGGLNGRRTYWYVYDFSPFSNFT